MIRTVLISCPVTERARHLRAHYALQCSDLRARVERRINRIPLGLRKANMGELFAKHADAELPKAAIAAPATNSAATTHPAEAPVIATRPLPPPPQSNSSKPISPARVRPVQPASTRGKKRKSESINIASDKENEMGEPEPSMDTLPVSKNPQRSKASGAAAAPRQVSRAAKSNSVLSPKSHNSRTLPRSPIKDYAAMPSSPSKPGYIARPISPLKPASPLKSAASAATSAISASLHGMVEQAKRGTAATAGKLTRTSSREKNPTVSSAAATKMSKMLPPPRPVAQQERTVSQSSTHSTTSNGSASSTSTTVVKKGGKTVTNVQQTTTATTTSKAGAMAKKAASAMKRKNNNDGAGVTKKVVVAEPAAGRRVLRKRN